VERLEERELLSVFTPGDLVVYRVGDGAGQLVSTGNAVFLDEYTPSGTLVQSIALPTSNSGSNKSLIASGVATSEGLLTLSPNNEFLGLTGYNATPGGTTGLAGSASTTIPRVVGLVPSSGAPDTTTALTDYANQNNPRSAVTTDGTNLWVTGAAGGSRYATKGGTTSTQLSTTVTNLRQTNIFGGQLYVSTSSGSSVRLGTVGTGLPTTSGQTITNLPGFPTSGSPYAFFFANLNGGSGYDTLYVADDTPGTIQKYSLVGGSWTAKGTASATGIRGLTGLVVGTNVLLYGTTGGNTATGGGALYAFTDTTGYNGTISGTAGQLATAANNEAFRGIAFSPLAAGTTLTVATTSVNPAQINQSITFNAAVVGGGSAVPTGTVSFLDGNTTLQTVSLVNGRASLTTTLAGGYHTITVAYSGDGTYSTSTSAPINQQVGQPSSTLLTSSVNPTVFGQPVTFTATVSGTGGTPTGTVDFKDGANTLATVALSGGTATYVTPNLSTGDHTITAVYAGDSTFFGTSSSPFDQIVARADTATAVVSSDNPSVFGQPVTFTATVTVNAPGSGTATGTVNFFDGATNIGSGTLDGRDEATLTTSALSVGAHTITASYVGDGDFNASTSDVLSQAVNAADTTTAVASSVNPSVYGQPVTLTATVTANAPGSGTPTGTVSFFDGATNIGSGTLDGTGMATLTTGALGVGDHTLTAAYAGDANFNTSTSGSLGQTVDQADTATTVVSSSNPSQVGHSVTFTATVTAVAPGAGVPTGTATFYDGATPLAVVGLDGSGQAAYTTDTLSIGDHFITVAYSGDGNFVVSTSGALDQDVTDKDLATATVVSSLNPSVYGQSVTFTATVTAVPPATGTPTGTVTFFDGAASLGSFTLDTNGQASVTTAALTAGGHAITVTYSGDADFSGTTSDAYSQTVNAAGTSTALVSDRNPSTYGQVVTFTATVTATPPGSGIPSGSVTFFDGSSSLGTVTLDGSGQATLATGALGAGGHSVTVAYAGDGNFSASTSDPLSQSVNPADTMTALASSANPSVFGQQVTFTATVTANAPGAGVPTGTVNFFDGASNIGSGTLNGSGVATFATSGLGVGAHSITAAYQGSGNYNVSTSTPLTQNVSKADTTTAVASSANPSVFGQSVTFTATVTANAPGSGTPTGSVLFFDGPSNIGSGNLNGSGVATFATSGLSVGAHSITAAYQGSGNYNTSTSTVLTQNVNKANTTTAVVSSLNPSVFGQSVTFTATVTANAPGSGTPAGSVNFLDGAAVIGSGTLNGSGVATFATSGLAAGAHSITAAYQGSGNYNVSTSTPLTQNVSKADTTTAVASSVNPSFHHQPVVFTATVSVVPPGAGVPTGSVQFFDGVTSLGTASLNGSGQASLTVSTLGVGAHSITAAYQGSGNFNTSTSGMLTQNVNALVATWVGGAAGNPTAWSNPANWSPAVAPGDGDEADFTNNGSVQSLLAVVDSVAGGAIRKLAVDATWGGEIKVNTALADTESFSLASGLVDGPGAVTLQGTSSWTGGTITISAGGVWTNAGTLTLTGAPLALSGAGSLVNSGTLVTTPDTTVAASFTNTGTLQVNSGTLRLDGAFTNFSGLALTGGTYKLSGTFQFNGADIVTNAAVLELTGPNSRIVDQLGNDGLRHLAVMTSGGAITLQSGRAIVTPGSFTSAGALNIKTGGRFTTTGVFTQTGGGTALLGGGLKVPSGMVLSGGVLTGKGSVLGNVTNNNGTVSPGGAGAAGRIRINGTYSQGAGGTLAIDIGGLVVQSQYDQLTVAQAATIAGTLNVALINGFVPANGDTFQILVANAGLTGTFGTTNGLVFGNQQFVPTYSGFDVTLVTQPFPAPPGGGRATRPALAVASTVAPPRLSEPAAATAAPAAAAARLQSSAARRGTWLSRLAREWEVFSREAEAG
jgi:hypothetical protein